MSTRAGLLFAVGYYFPFIARFLSLRPGSTARTFSVLLAALPSLFLMGTAART